MGASKENYIHSEGYSMNRLSLYQSQIEKLKERIKILEELLENKKEIN